MKKYYLRKYSIAWWAKKIGICFLAIAILAASGLSDMPESADAQTAATGAQPVIVAVSVEDEASEEETAEGPVRKSLGTFTITAYCCCETCCGEWSNPENPQTASGTRAIQGVTVGADWETISEGTIIEIEGIGQRIVQDKPAGWIVDRYDGKIIDMYFDNHQAAWDFGKRTAEVWEVIDAE